MFNGIIESQGKLLSLKKCAKVTVLRISLAAALQRGLKKGDSVAVNGVCLTARSLGRGWMECDLLDETLRRTNLGDVTEGGLVNLERSLKAGQRLGGHFLSGHVDVAGTVARIEKKGADRILTIATPAQFGKFLVEKGSVGMDGISLTVVRVTKNRFSVHLIPHTLQVTTLGERQVGDRVNLEFDMMAKYLWKWMQQGNRKKGANIRVIWKNLYRNSR